MGTPIQTSHELGEAGKGHLIFGEYIKSQPIIRSLLTRSKPFIWLLIRGGPVIRENGARDRVHLSGMMRLSSHQEYEKAASLLNTSTLLSFVWRAWESEYQLSTPDILY